MKYLPLSGICLLLAICLLSSGCISSSHTEAPLPPCSGQEPVVGAWIYDPGGMGDADYLYIFKESGRFDAVAVPRNAGKDLTYEVWLTGTWVKEGDNAYNVSGNIYRSDSGSNMHEEFPYGEVLVYDPMKDALVNEDHPRGIFIRASCKPDIPPGMNVSIPFD